MRPNATTLTPEEFVDEYRQELIDVLLTGDRTLRAMAIAILLEGGSEADVEVVHRELELYEDLNAEMQEKLREKKEFE